MKTFETLFALVEQYAKSVGIEEWIYSTEHGDQIWGSKYSMIALWKVSNCSINSIVDAKRVGQQTIDEVITLREKEYSTVIDGYLILVLPERPDEKLREFIRQIEMDTGVCRKHVVWPEDGASPEEIWRRIFKVTVLGLPSSPGPASGVNMPNLDESQKRIWSHIRKGSAASAAGKLLAEGGIE